MGYFSQRLHLAAILASSILVLLLSLPARAAFEFRPIGARAGGMGDTFAGLAEGAEALFWNPAAIAWEESVGAIGGYERPFGMAELETGAFGVVVPLGRGAVGVSYAGYGFALYMERAVGVTYGHAFSPRLGMGATVRGLQVEVDGAEGRRWTVFDLGVHAYLKEGVSWGLSAWNVSGEEVGLLGQGGIMGVGFEAGPGLTLLMDVRKEAGWETGISVGIEYRLAEQVALRSGAGGHPERLAFGVGVRKGPFAVDYAASYHTVLGLSHRVSVTVGRRPSR